MVEAEASLVPGARIPVDLRGPGVPGDAGLLRGLPARGHAR